MIRFTSERKTYSLQKHGNVLDRSSKLRLCSKGSHGHSPEADVQGISVPTSRLSRPEEVDPLGVARTFILKAPLVSLGYTSGCEPQGQKPQH